MKKRIISWLIVLIALAVPVVGWAQRNTIYDAWRLRGYVPSQQIVSIADVTTMRPDTRRLFYVYHPTLEDRKGFSARCGEMEHSVILGCYVSRQGIYLYNVSDDRLAGVIEVTAAHEVLHAAYERLGTKERQRIDALTATQAATITDERFKKTVDNYRDKGPAVVANELHSILATEIQTLSPELEAYYARYFTDRQVVVGFAQQYRDAFTSREKQVAEIDKQLQTVKQDIDSCNVQLEAQQNILDRSRASLQAKRSSGDIAGYNQGVPEYNRLISSYNALARKQQALVKQYNTLVETRNNLAVEENELIKALDSRQTIETEQ